jgi:uncharacterized repeat protein (TIGR01451 family)
MRNYILPHQRSKPKSLPCFGTATRNISLVSKFILLVFMLPLLSFKAQAESLSPPSINGSYTFGGSVSGNGNCTTNNLGGSTANSNSTATLNGLGVIGTYSFDVTASIVRGASSNSVWANGVCFPSSGAIRFQATKVPTTANGADGSGYASYQFGFSQGVKALSFKINGLDNGDYAEIVAYNGASQVALSSSFMTPDAGLTSYTPFVDRLVGGTTDNNAIGYFSPSSSSPLSLAVNLPITTTVSKIVVRYGKQDGNTAAATSFFDNFKWDVVTKLRVKKISDGGTGSFAFAGATNLASLPPTIITTTSNVAEPPSPTAIAVTASGTDLTITEAALVGYALSGFSCTDANRSATGNPTSFGSFDAATRTGTVIAAHVRADADITCTFTNTLVPPALTIVKNYTLSKTSGNTNPNAEVGDTLHYSYVITNTGGQVIANVSVGDVHSGSGSFAIPSQVSRTDNGTLGDSPDSNSSNTIWGTLAPQDVVTFASSYVVVQQDLDTQ